MNGMRQKDLLRKYDFRVIDLQCHGCRANCPDLLNDIYIGHARLALEMKDHEKAESYLLRANRADIILKYYKEYEMWQNVLQIARDYIPDSLNQLQAEYEEVQLKSGAKGAESFLAQAKDYEFQEDYAHAIDCYLKVNKPLTTDKKMILQAYTKVLSSDLLSWD